MKQREDTWGWMLAVDFFFAGMGGGMLVIAGIADLFLGNGKTSIVGNFAAPLFIALGASFLILELGRPLQAWRVFLNPKAILTIGAWNMLVAIGFGLAFASFDITSLPWSEWVVVRKILALLCVVVGLIVATYPGILLGRHKSRPFWTGPGIMVLFLISSLVTGAAAHLLGGLASASQTLVGPDFLPSLAAGLLVFQLIFWPGMLWIKSTGSTQREAVAVGKWLRGEYSLVFWGGFLLAGTLLPILLLLLPGGLWHGAGALLVLFAGLWMRVNVINSGSIRTWLPGEEKYRSRLPHGDEEFLKAWSH